MTTIQEADRESAAVAKAPRVSLAEIEAAILHQYHVTGADAVGNGKPVDRALDILSICILFMRNGFTVIGKSAPASPENFNADLGKKLAYEDCIRQLWALMGFALRDRLSKEPA